MKQKYTKLTAEQKESWNQNGFLSLPNIMPSEDVKKFRNALNDKKLIVGFINYHLVKDYEELMKLLESKKYNTEIEGAEECIKAIHSMK